ncbi:MAG: DUF1653 domain-containing protein [Oscillospiraceae bacterium]
MTEKELCCGTVVQHFKRGLLTEAERAAGTKYLYEILGTALHTETREKLVIYRALYDGGEIFARPLDMFLSETDREKYPEATQKFRFERVTK